MPAPVFRTLQELHAAQRQAHALAVVLERTYLTSRTRRELSTAGGSYPDSAVARHVRDARRAADHFVRLFSDEGRDRSATSGATLAVARLEGMPALPKPMPLKNGADYSKEIGSRLRHIALTCIDKHGPSDKGLRAFRSRIAADQELMDRVLHIGCLILLDKAMQLGPVRIVSR